jgi:branched-chain amino acid transport system ATP-binding protein
LPDLLLQVTGLSAQYGPVTAVRDVSLEVAAGEIVALLGANGAGKTTTLVCIAGLHRGRTGSIRFAGREIGGFTPERILRLGISLTPEGRRLFSTLTVEENLLLGGAARRVNGELDELLELFPILRERLKLRAGALSGGEQQQLALARSLMSGPRLLLLDEPTLGLAPRLVRLVFELIARLRTERGLSVLLVEQNVHLALDLCDRAYVLRTGQLAVAGTPDEVRRSREVESAYLGVA